MFYICGLTNFIDMEETTQKPSIADLWAEFNCWAMAVTMYWGTVADTHPQKARAIELRKQLLERAEKVLDTNGYYTRFQIVDGVLDSFFCHPYGERSKCVRYDNAQTVREMSAAYAFWAWELEQRKSETNG